MEVECIATDLPVTTIPITKLVNQVPPSELTGVNTGDITFKLLVNAISAIDSPSDEEKCNTESHQLVYMSHGIGQPTENPRV